MPVCYSCQSSHVNQSTHVNQYRYSTYIYMCQSMSINASILRTCICVNPCQSIPVFYSCQSINSYQSINSCQSMPVFYSYVNVSFSRFPKLFGDLYHTEVSPQCRYTPYMYMCQSMLVFYSCVHVSFSRFPKLFGGLYHTWDSPRCWYRTCISISVSISCLEIFTTH